MHTRTVSTVRRARVAAPGTRASPRSTRLRSVIAAGSPGRLRRSYTGGSRLNGSRPHTTGPRDTAGTAPGGPAVPRGASQRQGVALGRLALLGAGKAANEPDQGHGQEGPHRRPEEVDPPAVVAVPDDVRPQGACRVHRRAADRAGEEAEQGHRGPDRQSGVVADAAVAGRGVEDDA